MNTVCIAAPRDVRVQLFSAYPAPQQVNLQGAFNLHTHNVSMHFTGLHKIEALNHELMLQKINARNIGRPIALGSSVVLAYFSNPGLGIQYHGHTIRFYPGQVTINATANNQLNLVNTVVPKLYVESVVGSETLSNWPLEALKAQAVLTQTNLARQPAHSVIPDSTQLENYQGLATIRPAVKKTVDAVWGEILTYHNRPIQALYHSTCAGGTSDGRYFTGSQSLPYIQHVACRYCSHSRFYPVHKANIPLAGFQQVFGPGVPCVVKTDAAHRPVQIKLGNGQLISGYAFWLRLGQLFGWDKAPGTRYWLNTRQLGILQIQSTGAGHGLGLCQWGAAQLAKRGKTYQSILHYYFPMARLKKQNRIKASD